MNKIGAKNMALHIDLCSPIATSPTWSKLPKEAKERLTLTGNQTFDSIIGQLKPDIIVASIGKGHLNSWRNGFWDNSNTQILLEYKTQINGAAYRVPPTVKLRKIELSEHSCLFANGSIRNMPFDLFLDDRKYEVGRCLDQVLNKSKSRAV